MNQNEIDTFSAGFTAGYKLGSNNEPPKYGYQYNPAHGPISSAKAFDTAPLIPIRNTTGGFLPIFCQFEVPAGVKLNWSEITQNTNGILYKEGAYLSGYKNPISFLPFHCFTPQCQTGQAEPGKYFYIKN